MAYEFYVGRFLNGMGLEDALKAINQPVAAAGLLQAGNLQGAFRSQGHGPRGGQRWPDWSEDYAKDRARKGRSTVLVDSGILRQSITSQVVTEGPKLTVLVGTNVWYASVHQDGVRKLVYRRAHHRTMRRKRGRWAWDPTKGKSVFRKGRKLKPRIVQLPDGRELGVLPRQQVQAQAFRLTIPARPVAVVTPRDARQFQTRVRTWVNEAINGRGAR